MTHRNGLIFLLISLSLVFIFYELFLKSWVLPDLIWSPVYGTEISDWLLTWIIKNIVRQEYACVRMWVLPDCAGAVIQIQEYGCTHHMINHTYSCVTVASNIYLNICCNSCLYRKEGRSQCYVRLWTKLPWCSSADVKAVSKLCVTSGL